MLCISSALRLPPRDLRDVTFNYLIKQHVNPCSESVALIMTFGITRWRSRRESARSLFLLLKFWFVLNFQDTLGKKKKKERNVFFFSDRIWYCDFFLFFIPCCFFMDFFFFFLLCPLASFKSGPGKTAASSRCRSAQRLTINHCHLGGWRSSERIRERRGGPPSRTNKGPFGQRCLLNMQKG